MAASLGAEVAAFGLDDGAERWRRTFEPAVYGSGDAQVSLGFFGGAAACGRRLVMASDRVRCLDLRDGSTIWEADPLRGPSDDDYFWGPPVIAAGRVLLGSGAGSEATATRGRVSAYDLHDGTLGWSTPLVPEGANGGGVLAPVTVDLATGSVWAATGAPYVPTPEPVPGASALVELSLRSGRVRWQDDVHPGDTQGLDLNSAPVLDGSTVGVTGKDGVWAWDRRTRERRWHVQLTPATPSGGGTAGPTNGPEGGPIAADDGRFLVLSNDEDRASRWPRASTAGAAGCAGGATSAASPSPPRPSPTGCCSRPRRAATWRCCGRVTAARSRASRSASPAPARSRSASGGCSWASAPSRSCPAASSSAWGRGYRNARRVAGVPCVRSSPIGQAWQWPTSSAACGFPCDRPPS